MSTQRLSLVSGFGLHLMKDPAKQALTKFCADTALIRAYCNSLESQHIDDPIDGVPEWFDGYKKHVLAARQHAASWRTEIHPSINIVPQVVLNYGLTFNSRYGAMIEILKKPESPQGRAELSHQFGKLIDAVSAQEGKISSFHNSVVTFSNNMDADAKKLSDDKTLYIDKYMKSQKAEVAALTKKIEEVRLVAYTMSLTQATTGIIAGSGLFLGVIGIGLCLSPLWPLGVGAVLFGVGAGIGGSAGVISSLLYQKGAEKDLIELNKSIAIKNHNFSVMQAMSSGIDSIVKNKQAAANDIEALKFDFGTLKMKMEELVNKLKEAVGEKMWSEIKVQLEEAKLHWDDVRDWAKHIQKQKCTVEDKAEFMVVKPKAA